MLLLPRFWSLWFWSLLVWTTPPALGHLEDQTQTLVQEEVTDQDLLDLEDFDFDFSRSRVPRQVQTLLNKETKPHIQELSITTTIVSRYAFTAVYCAMLNRHADAREAEFSFPIPSGAFVSNFTMIIGGRVYQSLITPKEKRAKQDKGQRKESGDASAEPQVEVFKMAATIPGRNRGVFLLTYEQLLQRRLGRYRHVSSLRPRQLVSRLSLHVTIVDHAPVRQLEVLPLRKGRTAKPGPPITTKVTQEGNVCRVSFTPSIIQQAKTTTDGDLGDFVILYDVERDTGAGDVQVLNGHFVHHFAPKDLPVVPKNVVFVIDTSASMLGTKIRQTKEALMTILGDLRPDDHFNFISFSNRVKVWQPARMVPVTPLSVRDAKKFIYTLMPTGGTNIDGAVQTGSALLRSFLSGAAANPNSVSLLIFLTDGRPTVGETQSAAILDSARLAAGQNFCVFTIGLGSDVDYRLLERLAHDNCGAMRRIHEEADAGAMIKGFYDEIGTPMLSDIRINYPPDSVEYVTQNLFPNYFNGSELVVAGKLRDLSAESLRVQVTASNNDKTIVLETDVALRQRQARTQKHVKEVAAALAGGARTPGWAGVALASLAADFVEHAWGFLSVTEGLRARLRSRTAREREALTERARNVSLSYNFLSPLTRLVVERPQVLADGSMAPPPTANELPGSDEEEGEVADPKPGSQTSSLSDRIGKVERRKPDRKSITVSKTSADGDPHFVVEFPLSKLTVCFNINGEPGHVLRLLTDHKHSGVTVNGKLVGAAAPPGSHKQHRTYFSAITVVADRPGRRAYIEVTPQKVILDGQDRLVLPCGASASVESGAVSVSVVAGSNVTVVLGGNISFVVLLHHYKNPAPYQTDHLGFYIANSKGLSQHCHGLLGQFLHEDVGLVRPDPVDQLDPAPRSAVLKVKDRSVAVVQKRRRLLGGTQSVDCWFARNNAAKLIDGGYQDYLSPHMFHTGEGPHGSNRA